MRQRHHFTSAIVLAFAGAAWSAPAIAQNLVANASFDEDLQSWSWNPAIDYWSVAWSSEDADGASASGSVAITFTPKHGVNGVPHGVGVLGTGIAVENGRLYEFGAKVRVPAGQAGAGNPGLTLWWDPANDPGGDGLTQELALPAATSGWTSVTGQFRAPTSSGLSLMLGLAKQDSPGTLTVQFDDVYVHEVPDHTYLIGGVAHTHGVGQAYWVSDLTVFNPGPDAAQVELSFKGNSEAGPVQRTIGGGSSSRSGTCWRRSSGSRRRTSGSSP
jgi:hypothetical protein